MSQVQRVIRDVPRHWVGDGFPVRSLFSYQDGSAFDPFLLLDYAGPHRFAPGTARRGVGEHPHRGFETVTIVLQGELEHRDSSGSHGTIGAGDVQWMTAAAGVVHEEFHSDQFVRDGGVLEMLQLWVNLPARHKMTSPKYQNIGAARIPSVELAGRSGVLRVIAGAFGETRGPASTFTPIDLWDVSLDAGRTVELPLLAGRTAMIVVQSGVVRVGETELHAGELALLDRSGGTLQLMWTGPARLFVLSGEPLNEPVAGQGPFVMNTREEIQQAIVDFRSGRMGRLA